MSKHPPKPKTFAGWSLDCKTAIADDLAASIEQTESELHQYFAGNRVDPDDESADAFLFVEGREIAYSTAGLSDDQSRRLNQLIGSHRAATAATEVLSQLQSKLPKDCYLGIEIFASAIVEWSRLETARLLGGLTSMTSTLRARERVNKKHRNNPNHLSDQEWGWIVAKRRRLGKQLCNESKAAIRIASELASGKFEFAADGVTHVIAR
jgi:hypothetical protein